MPGAWEACTPPPASSSDPVPMSAFLSPSLPLGLCLSLAPSLSVSLSPRLSVSVSVSVSLSLFMSLSVSLSVSVCPSISVSLSLSLCLCLPPSLFLFLSLSLSLSLCVSLSLSHYLSLCLPCRPSPAVCVRPGTRCPWERIWSLSSGLHAPQTCLPHPGGKGQGPDRPLHDPHPASLDELFRECPRDPWSGVGVGSRAGPGLA